MRDFLGILAIIFMIIGSASFLYFLFLVYIKKDENKEEIISDESNTMIKEVSLVNKLKVNNFAGDKEEKLVIHYSSLSNPFVEIYYFNEGKINKSRTYFLNDYQIEEGKIVNIEGLASLIKEDFNYNCNALLLVSSEECFKNVVSLPKINKSKANKIFNKELKENFKDYKNDYYIFTKQYNHSLGYIYNTFFIPNSIIDNIRTLAYLLDAKVSKVDLFGNFIFNLIKDKNTNNYSVIYKENNYCLLLNVYNNNLTTIYNFSEDDVLKIVKKYLLIVSKHEFEFEKEKIDTIFVSEEIYDVIKDKLDIDVKVLDLKLKAEEIDEEGF